MLLKLDVIRVERLQSAWALELLSPRFSHNRGACHDSRSGGNHTQRPVRAFLWRLFHTPSDKITAVALGTCQPRNGLSLQRFGFFRELAIGIVNVTDTFALSTSVSQPDMIRSLNNCCRTAFFSPTEVLPIISRTGAVAYGSRPEAQIDCASSTVRKSRRNAREDHQQRACADENFTKRFIEGLILGDDPWPRSRSDLAKLHCLRRNPAITRP